MEIKRSWTEVRLLKTEQTLWRAHEMASQKKGSAGCGGEGQQRARIMVNTAQKCGGVKAFYITLHRVCN